MNSMFAQMLEKCGPLTETSSPLKKKHNFVGKIESNIKRQSTEPMKDEDDYGDALVSM